MGLLLVVTRCGKVVTGWFVGARTLGALGEGGDGLQPVGALWLSPRCRLCMGFGGESRRGSPSISPRGERSFASAAAAAASSPNPRSQVCALSIAYRSVRNLWLLQSSVFHRRWLRHRNPPLYCVGLFIFFSLISFLPYSPAPPPFFFPFIYKKNIWLVCLWENLEPRDPSEGT